MRRKKIFFLLILGFILFYCEYYVLCMYPFVISAFLKLGLEKFQFSKPQLKLEHHIIDCEQLPTFFELKIYHIIFIIISVSVAFVFNILIGAFYLMFILLGVLGAFFKMNIYNVVPKRLYVYFKNFRKDFKTISYYWSNDFFFFKFLNLIALPLGIVVLVFSFPLYSDNGLILNTNLKHAGIIFCTHLLVSFLIDCYIIFFANSSVVNKFGHLCYRRAAFGAFSLAAGNVVEKQILHNNFYKFGEWLPTIFTNVLRVLTGLPIASDFNQYLPDITFEQYTVKRNLIFKHINSTKANEIILENKETLLKNATKQELYRIRLGQGFFSDSIDKK